MGREVGGLFRIADGREEILQERIDADLNRKALAEFQGDLERRTAVSNARLDKMDETEKQAEWSRLHDNRAKKERAGVRFGFTRSAPACASASRATRSTAGASSSSRWGRRRACA